MLVFAVVSFLLILVSAYLVARPFLLPEKQAPEEEENPLVQEKEKLLDAIRELDLDFATGKLSEEDYRELRERYKSQAALVLKAIREQSAEVPDALTYRERPGDEAPSPEEEVEMAVEKEILEKKVELASRSCPNCGALRSPEDRFCRMCGTNLTGGGENTYEGVRG